MRHSVLLALLATACVDYGLEPTGELPNTGIPVIEVSPEQLDFWSVSGGEQATLAFTVRNLGGDFLTLDALELDASQAFSVEAPEPGLLVAPGESIQVPVTFAPLDPTGHQGLVSVLSSDPQTPRVDVGLVGQGVMPALQIIPEQHDFGALPSPCSDEVLLTLQNVGSEALDLGEVSYQADAPFTIQGVSELPSALPVGGYALLTVGFQAQGSGSSQGVLTVKSSDPQGPLQATQLGESTSSGAGLDRYEVPEDPLVDILLAVDQSGSMEDDAAALADNFSVFAGELGHTTKGWHLGVVTYDHGCLNGGVLTADTPDLELSFAEAVTAGTDEEIADDEALFRLVDRALAQTVSGACNEGFLREGAQLHVVVVSDEPERSTEVASAWTWEWYLPRFQGWVSADPLLVVSGVIDTDGCNEGADHYLQAIEATDGEALSICTTDWSEDLVALAAASVRYAWSVPLSHVPDPTTLVVSVDGATTSTGWTWDEELSAVVFDELRPGQVVEVSYQFAAEACP